MASIFLSHSSQDNEVAGDLSRRLKEHGYDSLFLDFDPDSGIKGGRDWERELYRNLKLARAVIVLCSPSSMASRWCFVEIAQAKALGKAIFPVTISPCRIESILNDRQVIDLSAVGADEAYRRLFDGLRAAGLDPGDSFHWDPRRPPFPGLNYFDAQDAGIYFGREDEVRQVIETLTRLRRQGEPRLLVVIGSSGSGKSSLIRAGVLPRLGKDRSSWVLVDPFRPRTDPLRELAQSLFSAFPEGPSRPDWRVIRDRLRDESRAADTTSALLDYADDLTMHLGHREASTLIVVDQAEELLRTDTGDAASAFLRVLRQATERPGGRVFGLLTLRSDFLGSFQNHPALRGVTFADLPLGLLPVENFPQVIEGPADRAALTLEPGLVSSMIADARTDDALPLLAFTLREMYERCRDQEQLTLKVYRDDLGGIKGAVARVVERIKTESTWTPEVGRALRRAFLKLVRVNDEGQYTRQPCRWADLPDQAAPVLQAFVNARLLSSNGDVVEVTHESLFRVWPELAGWLDEGRELMLWRKNLQDEVEGWISHDHSPLYLLSGARVAEGRRWLASNADDFPDVEGEFITASIAAEDGRIARERAQQEKLRWLARCLAVAAIVASLIGVYAFSQRNEANVQRNVADAKAKAALKAEIEERNQRVIAEKATQSALQAEAKEKSQRLIAEAATKRAENVAKIATSRQLAALSVAERGERFDRALLLAVEALRVENTFEARENLYQAIQARPGLTSFLSIDERNVGSFNFDVAFSPDGKSIAAAYGDSSSGGVILWDVAAHKRRVGWPLGVKADKVWGMAFSPDGKTLAAGYIAGSSGGVVLWDVADGKRLEGTPLDVKEGSVFCIAFSSDGKTLAAGYTAGDSGGAVVWDVAARKRLTDDPLAVKEGAVYGIAFSPDGKTLAAGYNVREKASGVVLWDVAARQRLVDNPLVVKEGDVRSVAFSPDGKTLAAGYSGRDNDGGVVLWDLAARKRLTGDPFGVKDGGVAGVAFSPDGKSLAAGYVAFRGSNGGFLDLVLGGGVVLWDLESRKRLLDQPFSEKSSHVGMVAFSPDGKTLAARYNAGVVLWDVAAQKRLVVGSLAVNEGKVVSIAFSPDGKNFAAGHSVRENEGGVVFWDMAARKRWSDAPHPQKLGPLRSVAFNPDGKTIAVGYSAGVGLWDVTARKYLGDDPLIMKEGYVLSVAFSPDGKTLAAEHYNGVALWDVVTRKRVVDMLLPEKNSDAEGVAFRSDGKTLAAGFRVFSGNRGGVVLWDVASREPLGGNPLAISEGNVTGVAFSPDGSTVAAGYHHSSFIGAVGGVVLWDVITRRRLVDEPLAVKEGSVEDVAFSPDGKTIAAAYRGVLEDGVVLWDLATRKRLVDEPLTVSEGKVEVMAFSPNGKTIVVGYGHGDEGGVVLLDVDPESWQRRAGQIANRNFTRKEWREYFPETPYRATFPDLPIPPEETPK